MSTEKEDNLEHIIGEENQHDVVALARVLCPFASEATDIMMLVCCAVVEAKGDDKWVARELGLSLAQVRRHCLSRLGERIIKSLAKNRLGGMGYLKAVCALEDVAGSESQTGNARRQAAEAIIKLADNEDDSTGMKAGKGIDLNTMTLAQLQSYVATIKQDLVRLPSNSGVQTIENEP